MDSLMTAAAGSAAIRWESSSCSALWLRKCFSTSLCHALATFAQAVSWP
jgi:hypothetical protein